MTEKELLEQRIKALEAKLKDIYFDFHVSEIAGQPKSIRMAWVAGQEIYQKLMEQEN